VGILRHQLIEIKHMATVKVYHHHRPEAIEAGAATKETTHVATVVTHHKGTEALEYAYRVTQNVDHAWTKGDGILFGLDVTQANCDRQRSTMVGDMMVLDTGANEIYKVAMMGFEK
jgi:hypothetical protein